MVVAEAAQICVRDASGLASAVSFPDVVRKMSVTCCRSFVLAQINRDQDWSPPDCNILK